MNIKPLRFPIPPSFLLAAEAVALVLLSGVEQSAAQMLAWPWCGLYGAITVLPWVVLAGGLTDWGRGCLPPAGAWSWTAVALAGSLIVSVAASPFGPELWVWLGVPLAGIAWFVVLYGYLSRGETCGTPDGGGGWPARIVGLAGVALSVASLGLWVGDQLARLQNIHGSVPDSPVGMLGWLHWWFAARNHQPLGHVNFTGGAALLFLPWLLWLAVGARCRHQACLPSAGSASSAPSGGVRSRWAVACSLPFWFWLLASALCLLMLVSSGSRGAWLGLLAAGGAAGLLLWRNRPAVRGRIVQVLAGALVGLLLVAVFNPPLRSALRAHSPSEVPNVSNAERWEMVRIGRWMGADRPSVGWGIGAVPLAYDDYRGRAACGPVNMLQVHSTPMNLWAEGGILLVLAVGSVLLVAVRDVWRGSVPTVSGFADSAVCPAGVSLFGYTVFALTDYQLDLPIVTFMIATNLAFVAAERAAPCRSQIVRPALGVAALIALAGLGTVIFRWAQARRELARGDIDTAIAWQPQDTTLRAMRGLAWAAMANTTNDEHARQRWRSEARKDLEQATARGGHLEFAHFNLGWLVLSDDPNAAERHFTTALMVAPSRASAWLGLGLAQLRQGRRDAAVDALAMECLVNPSFLAAGWWTRPDLGALRAETLRRYMDKLGRVRGRLVSGGWPEPQARYLAAVAGWLTGDVPAGAVAAVADTAPNAEFWQALATQRALAAHPFYRTRRGDPAMAQRLSLALGQAEVPSAPEEAERLVRVVASAASDEAALRRLLLASSESSPSFVVTFPQTAGFGVRMRNPYAQHLRFCGPEIRNLPAEGLLPDLFPPAGWIYDDTVRSLVGPENRNVANALELPAARRLQ